MPKKAKPTLAEYAEINPGRSGTRRFWDSLPQDIQQQCIQGRLDGHTFEQMGRWLKSIGYKKASGGVLAKPIKEALTEMGADGP